MGTSVKKRKKVCPINIMPRVPLGSKSHQECTNHWSGLLSRLKDFGESLPKYGSRSTGCLNCTGNGIIVLNLGLMNVKRVRCPICRGKGNLATWRAKKLWRTIIVK